MIKLISEEVLTLSEAARQPFLPRRRNGKRPHVATIYRWAQVGIRGIRLETLRVGGSLCTSKEALQRFCEQLTVSDDKKSNHGVLPSTTEPNGPEKELERKGV